MLIIGALSTALQRYAGGVPTFKQQVPYFEISEMLSHR
jgi:hypothetical protein